MSIGWVRDASALGPRLSGCKILQSRKQNNKKRGRLQKMHFITSLLMSCLCWWVSINCLVTLVMSIDSRCKRQRIIHGLWRQTSRNKHEDLTFTLLSIVLLRCRSCVGNQFVPIVRSSPRRMKGTTVTSDIDDGFEVIVWILQVEHAPFARFFVPQRSKDLPKMAVPEGSENGDRRLEQGRGYKYLDLWTPDALLGHLTLA